MFGDTFNPAGGSIQAETNQYNIFQVSNTGGVSAFVGKVVSFSGGGITYSVVSGNENALVPISTNNLAKIRLYNTTRNQYALILNCVTASKSITFFSAVAGWQINDDITVASSVVTGAPISYMDLEIVSGPVWKKCIVMSMIVISGTAGDNSRLHPFEAYASSKQKTAQCPVAGINGLCSSAFVKMNNNVFSLGWTGAPTFVSLSEDACF